MLWKWLFGKVKGADQIEETGGSLMYIGVLVLMFVFLGYIAQVIITNLNISDISKLPIFGPVMGTFQNALQIGGTVLLVLFLITLLGSLVVVVGIFQKMRNAS